MTERQDQDELTELLPELRSWNQGGVHTSPAEWVGHVGNYQLAVGYSAIFWPRFILLDGYVLRDGTSEEEVRTWEEVTPGDRTAVEAMLNHIHIGDIHGIEGVHTDAPGPSEAQLRYLGRVLKSIHEVKLKAEFPQRTFVVDFNDEPGLDLIDYQLTFWQPN